MRDSVANASSSSCVCFQVACRTFITFMYKEFPLLKDASEISNLTRTKEIAASNQLNLISRTNGVHMEWDQRRIRNRLNLKSRGWVGERWMETNAQEVEGKRENYKTQFLR